MSDKEQQDLVWKAFKKGKRWAFTKIYEDMYDDLYRFGLKFLQNSELVKDLIHDVFFKVWQNKENLSYSSNFNVKAYLLKSLRATIINYKQRNKDDKHDSLIEDFHMVSSAEELYITKENKQVNTKKLKEAINSLTAKQKEAIYLHYIFRFSYKEVSVIMNIKPQSVRNLVHEGILKLKTIQSDFIK